MALTKISTAMISQSAASVDLNVDAGTFYVDTTNNRVGVGGKTDPDTPLHVVGTVTATLFAGSGASLTSIPNAALTNSSITINSTATSLGGSITLDTDDVAEGSSNLYYTNARADARIAAADTDDLSEGSSNLYYTDARVDARVSGGSLGNITTTGYIRGPATFTIDPAAHGDNTGTVVIAGNLQVDGTQTVINSTILTVDDKNITLASGSANAAAASGAGFTVDIGSGTLPSITYDGTNDEWDFNKPVHVGGGITFGTADSTLEDNNLRFKSSGAAYIDHNTASQAINFRVSNSSSLDTTALTISSNGNLSGPGNLTIGSLTSTGTVTATGGTLTGDLEIISTDDSSAASPILCLYRNSASPDDGDYLGQIKFQGESDTGATRLFAKITAKTSDVTNGTEDGLIETAVKSNGSNVIVSRQTGSALKLINGCALEVDGTVTATGGTLTDQLLIDKDDTGTALRVLGGSSGAHLAEFTRDVGGTGTIAINASGGDPQIKFASAGNTFALGVNSNTFEISDNSHIGTNTRFAITNTGNVGIGTSNPGSKLTVQGDIKQTTGDLLYEGGGNWDIKHLSNDQNIVFSTTTSSTTSEKMRIKADGNVGIGTTSPASLLSVQGDGLQIRLDGTANTSRGILLRNTGTAEGQIQTDGNMHLIQEDANRYMRFSTANTERMRIDSSGNVGIGVGNSKEAMIQSTNSGRVASNPAYSFKGDLDTGMFNPQADNTVAFATGGSERMRIDSSGNVGIGTTSPAQKFHVAAGYIHVDAGMGITWDNTHERIEQSDGKLEFFTNNGEAMTLKGSNLGIGTSNPVDLLHIKSSTTDARQVIDGHTGYDAELKFAENGSVKYTVGHDAATDNFVIGTANVDTQQRLVINADGKVGIGTTSPAAKLHISGNSDVSDEDCMLIIDDIDGSAGSRIPSIMFRSNTGGTVTNQGRIRGTGHAGMVLSGSSALGNDLVVQAGGVGIGTTSPDSTLHLKSTGDTRMTIESPDANDAYINFSGATNEMSLGFDKSDSAMYITNHGTLTANRRVTIKSTGNVGIGTTPSTGNLLDVAGKGYFGSVGTSEGNTKANMQTNAVLQLKPHDSNSTNMTFAQVNGGAGMGIQVSNGPQTANWDIALNPYGGKVGIGTSSPGELLSLYKSSGNTLVQAAVHANSTVGFEIKKTNATTQTWRIVDGQTVNGVLEFYDATNSATRMAIKGDGNVGIGTTNPGSKLTVDTGPNGSIPTAHIKQDGATNAPTLLIEQVGNGGNSNVNQGLLIKVDGQNSGLGNIIRAIGTNSNLGADIEAFTVKGSGKVGIGTTEPSAPLSIRNPSLTTTGTGVGGLRVHRPNAESQYGYFDYGYNGGGVNIGSFYSGSGASVFGTFTFRQHSQTTSQVPMLIDSVGKVGIGTTAPNSKLHVGSGTNSAVTVGSQSTPAFQIGGTDNYRLGMYTDNETGYIENKNGDDGIQFRVKTAGDSMRIDGGTGNVGINDNNPDRKLSIIGNNDGSSGSYPLSVDALNSDYTMEFRRNGNSEWWIAQASSGFRIHENGVSDQFSVNSGGGVRVFSQSQSESKFQLSLETTINANPSVVNQGFTTGAGHIATIQAEQRAAGQYGALNFWTANNGNPTQAMTLNYAGDLSVGEAGVEDSPHPGHKVVEVTATAATSNAWSTNAGNNGGYDVSNNDAGTSANRGSISAAGYYNHHVAHFSMRGNFSANTWYPFTTRSQLQSWVPGASSSSTTGMPMYFRVYTYDVSAGGADYLSHRLTDRFWFTTYSSNSNQRQQIPIGTAMGHAPNSGAYTDHKDYGNNPIQVAINHRYNTDSYYSGSQTFDILFKSARTGLDGTSTTQVEIYAYIG